MRCDFEGLHGSQGTGIAVTTTTTEIDRLWKDLVAARERGDHHAVRAIENAMRELEGATRFAHLSDEELQARIASLEVNRLPVDLLAYSPGGSEGAADVADLPKINRRILANQGVGVEQLRNLLVAERDRRAAARNGTP